LSDPAGESPLLEPFRERVPRASLHLLYSEQHSIFLSENLNAASHHPVDPDFVQWLRSTEMRSFVEASAAWFPTREGVTYRAPSGREYPSFLRVGNIQTSSRTLDAIFFWLIPHLRNTTGILTETWSISSTALNAARRLEHYSERHRSVVVEMLSTYHDSAAELRAEAREALANTTRPGQRTLVLLSAVATGGSLRRLRETLSRRADPTTRLDYLALYGLVPEPPCESLCNLGDTSPSAVQLTEDADEVDRTVIPIDKRTYTASRTVDAGLRLTGDQIDAGRQFFERYQGERVLAVHRDVFDSNGLRLRHHAIDIDVERMVELPEFRARFSKLVRELAQSPSLIVAPRHLAGEALGEIAVGATTPSAAGQPELIVHPDLHPDSPDTPTETIRRLGAEATILVVDDVSVTGTRLARYQKHLGLLGFKGRVSYVVGVARPAADREWTMRVSNLRIRNDGRHNDVHFVEKIVLPDWDTDRCPWCSELRALRILREALPPPLRSEVGKRENALVRGMHYGGLVDDALWSDSSLRMGTGSPFFEARNPTQADAVAAVAASLQRLRYSPDPLGWNPTRPGVLRHTNYLGPAPRFRELIFQAAILRCAERSELERWDDRAEQQRREMVRTRLLDDDPEKEAVLREFTLAVVERKLPSPLLRPDDEEALRGLRGADLLLHVTGLGNGGR
jgi:hypothetical protein